MENKIRFTTIINPDLLTKIKLISYFTNTTISNLVEDSLSNYLNDFENQNNLKIQDLISIKDKFDQVEPEIEKDSKSPTK